jgi:hypothetical protein
MEQIEAATPQSLEAGDVCHILRTAGRPRDSVTGDRVDIGRFVASSANPLNGCRPSGHIAWGTLPVQWVRRGCHRD